MLSGEKSYNKGNAMHAAVLDMLWKCLIESWDKAKVEMVEKCFKKCSIWKCWYVFVRYKINIHLPQINTRFNGAKILIFIFKLVLFILLSRKCILVHMNLFMSWYSTRVGKFLKIAVYSNTFLFSATSCPYLYKKKSKITKMYNLVQFKNK